MSGGIKVTKEKPTYGGKRAHGHGLNFRVGQSVANLRSEIWIFCNLLKILFKVRGKTDFKLIIYTGTSAGSVV